MNKIPCFVFISCVLTSCIVPSTSAQPVFMESVLSSSDINKSIIVSAPKEWNNFKIGEAIVLNVMPNTNSAVMVNEQDIQIFLLNGDIWILIQNSYTDFLTFIISSEGSPASRAIGVVAFPKLDKPSEPASLRIIVNGYLYDDNVVGEKIQAYVDVTLNP